VRNCRPGFIQFQGTSDLYSGLTTRTTSKILSSDDDIASRNLFRELRINGFTGLPIFLEKTFYAIVRPIQPTSNLFETLRVNINFIPKIFRPQEGVRSLEWFTSGQPVINLDVDQWVKSLTVKKFCDIGFRWHGFERHFPSPDNKISFRSFRVFSGSMFDHLCKSWQGLTLMGRMVSDVKC
jgi:hypothetical protein